MANVTGIEISPILQRLNSTTSYHPFDAETFSDWATEAGDIVTISRNGENYVSPVHTSRMVWKGKAPTMQMSATGNEKRDAVARVSRKKYGRGSAGLRSNEQIHRDFTSEDGILHSELHMTESYLRTEFVNEVGSLRGEFEITASGLRTEFTNEVSSLRGEFEVTASGLRTEFTNEVSSLRGEFEVTASGLRTEFTNEVSSLRGEFEVTASGLRTAFEDNINSLRGEFQVTASGLRTEFSDDINSLRGEFQVTASGLRTAFEDNINSLRGEFQVTASGLRTAFEDNINSLRGEFQVTASGLRTAFEDNINSLRGEFQVTASGLRTAFEDNINSLRGEFQVTASGLRTAFEDNINSLRGEFQVTASGLRTAFEDNINSLRGEFEVTASGLRTAFEDNINSLRGEFQVTASGLRTAFEDNINSLRGEFEVTASGLRTAFTDDISGLRGEFEVTASGLRTAFTSELTSVRTELHVTNSGFETRVSKVVDADGNIEVGRICVEINESNESEATIEARKIYLLGQTIANTITANYIATKLESVSSLLVQNVTAQDIDAASVKIRPIAGMGAINVATAYNGSSLTRSGNTYTLRLAKMNGDYDEYSFSRATTLSGAWSGRKFTVTASPQGTQIYTDLWSAVPLANISWNGTTATLSLNATIGTDETTYNAGDVTVNIGSFLQDKTGANKITANGTYTPDTGYIGFSQVEIDVAGSTPAPTTIGTSWNNGILTITASPQGTVETRVLQQNATTWSGDVATLPIESRYGSSQQYTEGVVYSATVDVSSKLTSARNAARAGVTLLAPSADAKTSGIDSSRVFTVKTTGRTNSSGTTENLEETVPLHLYWDGAFSSNVATVYMKWGSTPGSSGNNYAKCTVNAGTLVTNAGYAGRAAVTISDTLTWTTNPASNITVNSNAVTVKTTGRTNSSGTASESEKTLRFYSKVESWGTPSANKCYVYVTYDDSNDTSRIIRREVDATSRYRAGMQAVNLGNYTVDAKTSGIDGNRTFTVSTTGRLNANGAADNISKDVPLHLYWDGTFSSNVATVYLQSGTSGSSGTNYAKLTVNASTLVTNATTAGKNSAKVTGPTWTRQPSASITGTSNTATFTTDAASPVSGAPKSLALYLVQGSWSSNKKYVYLHQIDSTAANRVARVEVDASSIYNTGWTNAAAKVAFPSAEKTDSTTISISYPTSTVGSYANKSIWVANMGKDYADIRMAIDGTNTTIARVEHNRYTGGWTAAYNQIVFPANNTSSASMTLKTTSSAVDGTAATTTYDLVVDNNVAYIKDGNSVKAQITHNKYSNGQTAGYNSAKLLPTWDSNQANKLTISKTTNTSYANDYTLYVVAGLTDYTYNTTTHRYSIQGIAKAGTSINGATERNRSDAKSTGTEAYDAGWGAFYNTLVWAVAKKNVDATDNASMTEFHPSSIVDSASDAVARVYTLYNKSDDNNVVELRRRGTSTVMATITHGKYNSGWIDAAAKVTFPSAEKTDSTTISISYPLSTPGSYANKSIWVSDMGKNYADIRMSIGGTNTTIARVTHNRYTGGWTAAYNQIVFPANNTSSASMTLKTTSSAVDGTAATTTYDLVVDNNVAYIKDGNSVKAQITHNKFNNGKVAATPNELIYLSRASGNGKLNVRCRRNGTTIADLVVDITSFLQGGNLGMMAVSSAGSEHSQLDPGIYCIGGAGVYNTNKTWQVPNQNPTYSYSVTLTRYRAGAVEQIIPGTLYRRLTNGTYQELGDSSTYWYACKRDLGSSKTVHYN